MKIRSMGLVTAGMIAASAAFTGCHHPEIENMKCEYLVEPLIVDRQDPTFTWNYSQHADPSFKEAGHSICVAITPEDLKAGNLVDELESFTDYVCYFV